MAERCGLRFRGRWAVVVSHAWQLGLLTVCAGLSVALTLLASCGRGDPVLGMDASGADAVVDAGPGIDAAGWENPKAWWPYSSTSAWPSIHAGPFNSDYSFFDSADHLELGWHRLDDSIVLGIPVLDSSQGLVFVTTGRPDPPNLYAVVWKDGPWGKSGDVAWTARDAAGSPAVSSGAVSGSALLDEDGNLYVGDEQALWSFDSEGRFRWRRALPEESDGEVTTSVPFVSLIFVPTGQVGGVTIAGRLLLYDRETGTLMADHRLEGVLPFSAPTDDATDFRTRILEQCLWKDSQDRLMVDERVRMTLFSGFAGVGVAVSNTPAVERLAGSRGGQDGLASIYVPALLDSTDATGDQDLRLFRLDVRWEGDHLAVSEPPGFDGMVPGGAGSATSPTLTSDGRLVLVGDDHGVLHAFDGESGEVQWEAQVGQMLGSVTVDWPESRVIYVGTEDHVQALDRSTGQQLWLSSLTSMAEAALDPVQGATRVTLVDGIVTASSNELETIVILAYQKDLLGGGRPLIWPMQALFVRMDKQGNLLGSPVSLPGVADTGGVITQTGSVLIPFGATFSSLAHCLWRNYPGVIGDLPEPMAPVGGLVALNANDS